MNVMQMCMRGYKPLWADLIRPPDKFEHRFAERFRPVEIGEVARIAQLTDLEVRFALQALQR